MGLDIYVGSFTRYLAGEWELAAERTAKEMGLPIEIVRQHDPAGAIRDPNQIRPVVFSWRDSLSAALKDLLSSPLDWDEQDETPYFTDKPTWDCYTDLLLWAAYDEQRQLRRPFQHVEDWPEDPAYILISSQDAKTRYSHVYDVTHWLPCDFGFVFKANGIAGTEQLIGSSVTLLRQLRELNARTWGVDSQVLHQWRIDCAEHGSPLETGAKFAFSVLYELATESVAHHLPMLMDW